jgi:hypothetical protein
MEKILGGRNNAPVELSYFSIALRLYLQESHPDVTDERFIERRASAALDEYCRAVREGTNRLDAMERANAVLFAGLRFSKFEELKYIVREWFDEIPETERDGFCLKMLKQCSRIFKKYDPGDDFELSAGYVDMQLELTGFIQEYIERYGI